MASGSDVVIVGGGVVGTACAYFLSAAGVDVTVVEQAGVASGSSSHGPGFFNAFGGDFRPGSHLALAIKSTGLIREHRATLGAVATSEDWFNDRPDLALAFDETGVERLHQMYEGAREQLEQAGEPGRWLDAAAVRELEPVVAEDVLGGYRFDSVVQIDGPRLSQMYASAAEKQGAKIVLGEAVGVRWANSKVTSLELRSGGSLAAGSIVFAMGCWTSLASLWLGYPLPVCNLKGQLHVLRIPGYDVRHHLMERVVVMQYPNGLFLLGATPDPAPGGGLRSPQDYIRPLGDNAPSEEDEELLLSVGRRRFPFIQEAEVVSHLSGLRPMSADLLPMIGRVPVYENVFVATGHGRKGIHLSAGTGALIRDLIVDGAPETEAFSPSRFMPATL